jgi:zinc protease
MQYRLTSLIIFIAAVINVSASQKIVKAHHHFITNQFEDFENNIYENYFDSDSIKSELLNRDSLLTASANSSYAKEILKKYLASIGGEESLRNVNDRITDMKGIVQGIETEIIFYQKAPNKLCQKILVGEVEQRIIYDGSKGAKIIGETSQEITGNELSKLSFDAIMNLILEPENYNVKLQYKGLEKIDGRDSYKISLILPYGAEWIQFYDMETGLKIRDSKDIITPQGKFQQITEFDDYRDVEGIRYPFKIIQYLGNQTLDFTIESIHVNTGISEDIFLIEQ